MLEELATQLWLPQKLESLRAGACIIIAFRPQGEKMLEGLSTQLWLPQKFGSLRAGACKIIAFRLQG